MEIIADNFSIKDLLNKSKINNKFILDGACGCFLQEKFPTFFDNDIWMTKINTHQPEEVKLLAKRYLDNGANILTSNTFRTNPSSLEIYNNKNNTELSSNDEVKKALDILLSLRTETNKKFLIAGSNSSAEDCYIKKQNLSYEKIKDNHVEHIRLLSNYGADIILNETQSFYNEIEICSKFCLQNNINYIISMYINEDLKLNSGELVLDVLKKVDELNPIAISFNCISEETFKKLIEIGGNIIKGLNCGFGFYLNCGDPSSIDNYYQQSKFYSYITPDNYVQIVKDYHYLNPIFVGCCCMSTPQHIKKIHEYFSLI